MIFCDRRPVSPMVRVLRYYMKVMGIRDGGKMKAIAPSGFFNLIRKYPSRFKNNFTIILN